MVQNKKLVDAANALLAKYGFTPEGDLKKGSDRKKRQRFFEKKTVIMTPMGNGMR